MIIVLISLCQASDIIRWLPYEAGHGTGVIDANQGEQSLHSLAVTRVHVFLIAHGLLKGLALFAD